jgi:hypothetical protein
MPVICHRHTSRVLAGNPLGGRVECGAGSRSTAARPTSSRCTGARALAAKIRVAGIDVHHEELDDGHMNIPDRYDHGLPFVVRAITGRA